MIEAIVVSYLGQQLTVPVYAERPERPDPSYIIIERTGGGISETISRATIALQCYAPTMLSAIMLCEDAVKAMQDIDTLPEISSVDINSFGYNFTDPAAKEYRYQAIIDLVYFDD